MVVAYSTILVRATNWVGDAVMSLPALRALRGAVSGGEDFDSGEAPGFATFMPGSLSAERRDDYAYTCSAKVRLGRRSWRRRELAERKFDCAILLQNAFDAAAIAWMARIPERIGYARDGRRLLLTKAIAVPKAGEIPAHERFYYLELLRRAGIIEALPENDAIRLEGAVAAREAGVGRLASAGFAGPVIGVSPGAAYGSAKRWLPERFAEAATRVATELGAGVAIFGSAAEREVCAAVAAGVEAPVKKFRGRDDAGRVHRHGGGVPGVFDQRFGSNAYRIGAGRADGGGVRSNQRCDYGSDGTVGSGRAGGGGVQPVHEARVSN